MSSPIVVTFHPLKCGGRNQHREIRFAAGARKGRSDVMLPAIRRFHAKNQHVLGQPALLPRQIRTDPEREAFLAQQDIAAVAGTD